MKKQSIKALFIFMAIVGGLVASNPAQAKTEKLKGHWCYGYGDSETLTQAREKALALARQNAIESYQVFVESSSQVSEGVLSKELIKSVAAGSLKNVKITKQIEKNRTVCIDLTASLDPAEMKKLIKERSDPNWGKKPPPAPKKWVPPPRKKRKKVRQWTLKKTLQECETCPIMVVVTNKTIETSKVFGKGTLKIKPFAISQHETTFENMDACVAANGCSYKPDDRGWGRATRPVINVNWNDAVTYAKWVSTQTKQTYRLPTPEEWEYAARAGKKNKPYYWGKSQRRACSHANVADQTAGKSSGVEAIFSCRDEFRNTAPVKQFRSNDFGLYDMLGNVWEWMDGCHDKDTKESHGVGCKRAIRGGGWSNGIGRVNFSAIDNYHPEGRSLDVGFRLIRELK